MTGPRPDARPGVAAIQGEANHLRALYLSLSGSSHEPPPAVLTSIRSALLDLEDAAAFLDAYHRLSVTEERTPQ